MKRFLFVVPALLLALMSFAQSTGQRLRAAFARFEKDAQVKYAISSLYVINARTGEVVFDKNSRAGLAPASTQKIITAATAFELLGKDYRYKTEFFKNAEKSLLVTGRGDPTLGSWRYANTGADAVFGRLITRLRAAGDMAINSVSIDDVFDAQKIPGGWIYEDIGNYYGAGATGINWHENQYDIIFTPGKKAGDIARYVMDTAYHPVFREVTNECRTGPAGSGDNAYIYFVPGRSGILIKGTIPAGSNRFTISGADPDPSAGFFDALKKQAYKGGVEISALANYFHFAPGPVKGELIHTHYSPSLDSIIYWFLRKSINLYGEALVKTFGFEKKGTGATDTGTAIIRQFWKTKGLDEEELNMYDGSGLSPLNRLTTHAQVTVLQYARSANWFTYFYQALPEYNGMKMKSGSISDAKGFCGYHRAKDGNEYIFSFLVNNYSGPSSGVVSKMYQVLDVLK